MRNGKMAAIFAEIFSAGRFFPIIIMLEETASAVSRKDAVQ